MYCLNFNKDDIQFIKGNYVGVYSLLKARLSKYDEEYIWKSDNEADYRKLQNRFTYEIGEATSSDGKISNKGLHLQKIWNKQ